MLGKKISISCIAALTWVASHAYAGSEDWNGTFKIRGLDGNEYSVQHTPSFVHFLFFTMKQCLHLGQGASINGLKIPEDIDLCTAFDVDTFAKEVEKLGIIVNESVEKGPSYAAQEPSDA
ncbi:MAG: hypothetical protein NXI01_08800 [Gammaproteobacteria bacterium]|nr:hypothetical protein [Gammaproteobacteria bacterium]